MEVAERRRKRTWRYQALLLVRPSVDMIASVQPRERRKSRHLARDRERVGPNAVLVKVL